MQHGANTVVVAAEARGDGGHMVMRHSANAVVVAAEAWTRTVMVATAVSSFSLNSGTALSSCEHLVASCEMLAVTSALVLSRSVTTPLRVTCSDCSCTMSSVGFWIALKSAPRPACSLLTSFFSWSLQWGCFCEAWARRSTGVGAGRATGALRARVDPRRPERQARVRLGLTCGAQTERTPDLIT